MTKQPTNHTKQVGDKTIAMWLLGPEIYDGMSALSEPSPVVARGMALHKMIRCISMALGGEAWLSFMVRGRARGAFGQACRVWGAAAAFLFPSQRIRCNALFLPSTHKNHQTKPNHKQK
jgi:hypothetical protein